MPFLPILEVLITATLLTGTLWILISMLDQTRGSGFVKALAQTTKSVAPAADAPTTTFGEAISIRHSGTVETMTNDLIALARRLANPDPAEQPAMEAELTEFAPIPWPPKAA